MCSTNPSTASGSPNKSRRSILPGCGGDRNTGFEIRRSIYTLKSNRKIRLRIYLSQSFFLDVVSPFLEYVFAADLCFIKSVINTRTQKGSTPDGVLPFWYPYLPAGLEQGGGSSESPPHGEEKAIAAACAFSPAFAPGLLLSKSNPLALGFDLVHAGGMFFSPRESPATRTTSSRTSYRSRRRFLFQSKRRLSLAPSLLLSGSN